MKTTHRTVADSTAKLLREYAERYENADFIEKDPSLFMHLVSGDNNQETMAFIAQMLSYGSRRQFMQKIQLLLDEAGGEPYRWVTDGEFNRLFSPADNSCFYRLYTHADMYHCLSTLRLLLTDYGSLRNFIATEAGNNAREAIGAITAFFARHGSGGIIPKDTNSACKRLCMFLRWMVRDQSPVDIGLWAKLIDRRTLIMPLDTHVVQQSVRLGLLDSKTASMATARRLTERLAEIFPDDPLKGDFALFGYGVNS